MKKMSGKQILLIVAGCVVFAAGLCYRFGKIYYEHKGVIEVLDVDFDQASEYSYTLNDTLCKWDGMLYLHDFTKDFGYTFKITEKTVRMVSSTAFYEDHLMIEGDEDWMDVWKRYMPDLPDDTEAVWKGDTWYAFTYRDDSYIVTDRDNTFSYKCENHGSDYQYAIGDGVFAIADGRGKSKGIYLYYLADGSGIDVIKDASDPVFCGGVLCYKGKDGYHLFDVLKKTDLPIDEEDVHSVYAFDNSYFYFLQNDLDLFRRAAATGEREQVLRSHLNDPIIRFGRNLFE